MLRGLAANRLSWRLLIRHQRAGSETALECYVDVDPCHQTPTPQWHWIPPERAQCSSSSQ